MVSIVHLAFYYDCWFELKRFLYDVSNETSNQVYPVEDFMKLMRSIERKLERF